MLDKWSAQTVSTPFNIFENTRNFEAVLNESLNQFKFDSTGFQHYFTPLTMLSDALNISFNSYVERMFKQMLKLFTRAITLMELDTQIISNP